MGNPLFGRTVEILGLEGKANRNLDRRSLAAAASTTFDIRGFLLFLARMHALRGKKGENHTVLLFGVELWA